jgi:hypothetical protein
MQFLEIIGYEPNTFGTNEESGGNPENVGEIFREDAKFRPKRPYRLRTSPGRKGRKKNKKTSAPFFRRKNCFSDKVLCF